MVTISTLGFLLFGTLSGFAVVISPEPLFTLDQILAVENY